MSIIINGKVYTGNVTVVNGRVINSNTSDNFKEFNEIKRTLSNGICNITIESDVNVNICASDTNEIVAHLHGSCASDIDINLTMKISFKEVKICAQSNSDNNTNMSIISDSCIIINSSTSFCANDLTLDVKLPIKEFEKLFVESKNSNINILSSVKANTIEVNSKNGNIDVSAIFKNLNIDCKNGNIDIDSEAHSDVNLNLSSKNGNINTVIENIGISSISVVSKNGNCKNNPRLKGAYIASGCITSKNGNIRFR